MSYFPDDQSFFVDPYTWYAQVQNHTPTFWLPRNNEKGMWVFTRYEDVEFILKDLRFKKDEGQLSGSERGMVNMLSTDPPNHTRLRGLVAQAFTPTVIKSLHPRLLHIAEELVDKAKIQGSFELMRDFAIPFPVIILAELLGVPEDDIGLFVDWSNQITLGSDSVASTQEDRDKLQNVALAQTRYFMRLIAKRRRNPQNDLISALIASKDEGGHLTERELLGTCIMLLTVGTDTTVNLIGNGIHALLQHPEELHRLRNDDTLFPSAIEELLRFDAAVQRSTFRFAGDDVTVGGQMIETGQQVSALIGAANRDPTVFDDPHTLNLGRNPNRHLSFGRGIHYCLGAALARSEADVAFRTLLQHLPDMAFAVSPTWRKTTMFRGLEQMPLVGF